MIVALTTIALSLTLARPALAEPTLDPAPAASANASPHRPRYATPGLAASLGIGPDFAGIGVQVMGLWPLATRLPFTVFAGIGVGQTGTFDGIFTLDGETLRSFGPAVTAGASFGHRHRATAEIGWGAMVAQGLAIQGILIDSFVRYGVFAQAGYEFLGSSGVYFRILPLGIIHVPSPLLEAPNRLRFSSSVSIGWKPW